MSIFNHKKEIQEAFETGLRQAQKENFIDYMKSLALNSSNASFDYSTNWAIYTCVSRISAIVGSLPWHCYDQSGEIVENNVFNKFNRNPNRHTSKSEFFQALAGNLLLDGNGYIESQPKGTSDYKNPVDVYVLPSNSITIKPGPDLYNPIAYYEYGSAKTVLPVDRIVHIKLFNPSSMIDGVSPTEAAQGPLKSQWLTEEWNRNLMDKGPAFSHALEVPGMVNDGLAKSLKENFKANYMGANNIGNMPVMFGGTKIVPLTMTASDMQLNDQQTRNIAKVAVTYSFPTELLGLAEKTYSNYAEARLALTMETCLPLFRSILDSMTRFYFGESGMYFGVNENEIPIYKAAMLTQAMQLTGSWQYTPNEKRIKAGDAPLDEPGMDDIYIPAGMMSTEPTGDDSNL